jgi:hypothetical protein
VLPGLAALFRRDAPCRIEAGLIDGRAKSKIEVSA